jgi:Type III secretion needle MxiH like.
MTEIGNAVVEAMSTAPSIDSDEVFAPEITQQVKQDGVRFSDLVANRIEQPQVVANPAVVPASAAIDPKSLGDVLLKRLDVVGNNFTKNIQRTHQILDTLPADLRVQDMMRLQLEMASISLEVELVGKGVQKAVQHVDQLTKLQ